MSFSGTNPLEPTDAFVRRHIGPSPEEQRQMLASLGFLQPRRADRRRRAARASGCAGRSSCRRR